VRPATTLATASPRRGLTKLQGRIDSRELRLQRLGFSDYGAYLNSSRWKHTRARYWSDPNTSKVCSVCGTAELPLPLHHRSYERVGNERLEELTPVCPTCHQLVHALERRGDLDGLDADLSILSDPIRAARYSRESAPLVEARKAHPKALSRKRALARAEDRVRQARRNVAKNEQRGRPSPLAEAALERALRRQQEAKDHLAAA